MKSFFNFLSILLIFLVSCSSPQEKAKNILSKQGYMLTDKDLIRAISEDRVDIVKLFLEADYNLNFVGNDGYSPLLFAVKNNRLEITKLLVSANVNIDEVTKEKDTSLIIATRNNNLKIINILLDNNANAELYNKKGWSALMLAVHNNKSDLVKKLIRFSTNKQIDDSLLLSSKNGNTEITDILLSNGAYINNVSPDKNTALMFASSQGHFEVVKLLLKRGANRFLVNKSDLTASMIADNYNYKDIKDYLNQDPSDLLSNTINADENQIIKEKIDTSKITLASHTDAGIFGYKDVDDEGKLPIVNVQTKINNNIIQKKSKTQNIRKIKRLHNSSLPVSNSNLNLASRLVMKEYIEREIPYALKKVSESKRSATLQKLYGDNDEMEVRFGDLIPGSDYKLQSGKYIQGSTKAHMNTVTDMSEVYLKDLRDGNNYTLNLTNSGRSSEPHALLKVNNSDTFFDARVNDRFYDMSSNDDYEIINVMPNQIMVRSLTTGETFRIPK